MGCLEKNMVKWRAVVQGIHSSGCSYLNSRVVHGTEVAVSVGLLENKMEGLPS